MLFLSLFPFKRTKKCQRCGLRYPKVEVQCTHCSELTDGSALDELLMKKSSESYGNQNLGLLFLLLGGALAFVLILFTTG